MMRPYPTLRLRSDRLGADVADIKAEARPTRVGRAWRVRHGYARHPAGKHATRRHLKRADRARALREELRIEAEAERALERELEAIDAQFRAETEDTGDWRIYRRRASERIIEDWEQDWSW